MQSGSYACVGSFCPRYFNHLAMGGFPACIGAFTGARLIKAVWFRPYLQSDTGVKLKR